MSNILPLFTPARTARARPVLICLPELFAHSRHDRGDVRWLKENAEFLRLAVATGLTLDPAILESAYGSIAADLPAQLEFFPQYYRFFLSIAQDLATLGVAAIDAKSLTIAAMSRGLAAAELSDLQRAEAQLLAARAGASAGGDAQLPDRLLQFAGRSATFALPNRKAAYELTHIAFYLSDYGRHPFTAGVRLRDSLEYVGLIAWLEQDVDLLAEVCIALRCCGQAPPPLWDNWVAATLRRFALVPMADAAGQDDYHAWLMAAWAVAMAGGRPFDLTAPAVPFGLIAPPNASALPEISAVLLDLGAARGAEWPLLRRQLARRLSPGALALLDDAATATPRFAGFLAGFTRATPWGHAA